MKNEKDLQSFIAENPWLIDANFETVPQLENGGMEYQIGDQKRIDLILRDKITKRPVVVEFKYNGFYRENIGQILEYKARVNLTFNNNDNILHGLFKQFVLVPKLILVVKECDDFSRIACNLSGIDIVEYRNFGRILNDPGKVQTIKQFTESFKNDPIPLTLERGDKVEEVFYLPIKKILSDLDLGYAWKEPRIGAGFYQPQYANLFANRWLFSELDISIGILENFLEDENTIKIVYYGTDKEKMEKYVKEYNRITGKKRTLKWDDVWKEGVVEETFDKSRFVNDVVSIMKDVIGNYAKINLTTAST